ncbi:MAG: flagellar biosynthetic protein FliR [Lachnospiraceae bacterium]|nr:flagellar biosynthetic protein FliR [Lachnospiraceae bacterium]
MVSHSFSLETFEYFLLVLMRIASFAFIAPFYSQDGIPTRTRIGLCAIVSIMILGVVAPEHPLPYENVFGYSVLILKEAATGLLLGYACYICNSIVLFAGNVIDMNIGLSMVSMFDPAMSAQVTVTGNIYNQVVLIMLVVSNMHQYILRAVVDSFKLIPLGETVFRTDVLLQGMVVYFTDLFVLGFRIMMPVFATLLIVNTVLGIMAKVAPQMNMFSIGVQIKIIAGLLVLFVLVFLFPEVVELVANEMKLMIANMMDGLHE